ncbi:hypothetical protein ACHAWF_015187 [Thalassiosira exigua]
MNRSRPLPSLLLRAASSSPSSPPPSSGRRRSIRGLVGGAGVGFGSGSSPPRVRRRRLRDVRLAGAPPSRLPTASFGDVRSSSAASRDGTRGEARAGGLGEATDASRDDDDEEEDLADTFAVAVIAADSSPASDRTSASGTSGGGKSGKKVLMSDRGRTGRGSNHVRLATRNLPLRHIVREMTGIHARDFFSLSPTSLGDARRKRRRAMTSEHYSVRSGIHPWFVLPREGEIVVSFVCVCVFCLRMDGGTEVRSRKHRGSLLCGGWHTSNCKLLRQGKYARESTLKKFIFCRKSDGIMTYYLRERPASALGERKVQGSVVHAFGEQRLAGSDGGNEDDREFSRAGAKRELLLRPGRSRNENPVCQRESCLFGCSRSQVALRFGPFDASLVAGSSELGRGEPGMCFPLRIHATSFIWRLFRPFAIRDGEIIYFNPGGKGHLVPFELDMVEQIIKEVCTMYGRRIRLYEPIVNSLMARVTNEAFSPSGLHKLVPLKDSLQRFEMNVKGALRCITDLLGSEEDMLDLLLTEKALAKSENQTLELDMHEDVELVLEEYARQLNSILLEIDYMLQRVQSKQDMVALSLDAYRNRMIRMNLYLTVGGISMAFGPAVAGFFGMNVVNGWEEAEGAFEAVVLGSCLFGGGFVGGCYSYLNGSGMKARTLNNLNEIEIMNRALGDMSALDHSFELMLNEKEPLTKEKFREKNFASQPEGIRDAEVDFLFELLDYSNNAVIDKEDFHKV